MPRFRPENLERNLALVDALGSIAEAKGATVAQLAIAWVLARGQDIVPLVGTTRRDRLAEAVDAMQLELSEDDMAAIERAAPPGAAAGDRYDERQMGHARQRAQPSLRGLSPGRGMASSGRRLAGVGGVGDASVAVWGVRGSGGPGVGRGP